MKLQIIENIGVVNATGFNSDGIEIDVSKAVKVTHEIGKRTECFDFDIAQQRSKSR